MDFRFTNAQEYAPMGFPTINTGYDNLQLYKRILDPDLKILVTCSQVVVHVVRKLADSILLPFNIMEYAKALSLALANVNEMLNMQLPSPPGN